LNFKNNFSAKVAKPCSFAHAVFLAFFNESMLSFSQWQDELALTWCLRISRCLDFDIDYPFDFIEGAANSCKVSSKLRSSLDRCLKSNDVFRLKKAFGGVIISIRLNSNSSNPDINDRALHHKLDTARAELAVANAALEAMRVNIAALGTEANAHIAAVAVDMYRTCEKDAPSACWKLGELFLDMGDISKCSQCKKTATLMTCGEVCVKKGLPAPPWTQYTIAKFLY
jgi:hypothetical protein